MHITSLYAHTHTQRQTRFSTVLNICSDSCIWLCQADVKILTTIHNVNGHSTGNRSSADPHTHHHFFIFSFHFPKWSVSPLWRAKEKTNNKARKCTQHKTTTENLQHHCPTNTPAITRHKGSWGHTHTHTQQTKGRNLSVKCLQMVGSLCGSSAWVNMQQ